MKIQSLPLDVINLIAAGEVIDSPAAVVRELIENALDAAANRIVISIYPELWRIQVADNGDGMILDDLKICSQAHSTSKIYSHDDLWRITSLGFRGEALHSIAQVASLEIASRSVWDQDDLGWRIRYTPHGEIEKATAAAIASGTIITVSNLFNNIPVRRNALPPLNQQLKAIQTLIHQVALCHPQVTWQVFQDDAPWFKISPSSTSHHILPQILKSVHHTDLQALTLEIATPQDDFSDIQRTTSKLELVVGLPDRCHRHRLDWVKIAVNGRMIRHTNLEQTIISAFARTLPRDRFPVCFLHLQTCPSLIDWNRHPTKSEIYLQSLTFWQEQITIAIDQALKISPVNLPTALYNTRVSNLIKAAEEKSTYNVTPSAKSETIKRKDALGLIELTAVAQIRNTYIVAEHENGLWLVEQHIAHERVLYEKLQEHWEIIALETPIILKQLNERQVEQLKQLGLDIEPFGEQLWVVRSTPLMLANRSDCAEALIELSWGGDLETAQVATACRSAIRNGTTLTLVEMQTLLNQWKSTRNPRTCPHGRPIYLSLEESSLSRFFRRHWVIGKSHGI